MTPFPAPAIVPEPAPRGLSLAAVLSFVLGLLSIGLLLAFVTGIPAIVVGIFAIRRINSGPVPVRGRGLAFAGILLGIGGTFLGAVGLLAVFVLKAIDTSQRAECTNNLRQIGRATAIYHESNSNTFPPGSYYAEGRFQALQPQERLSWMVTLLPYLEKVDAPSSEEDDTAPPPVRNRVPLGTTVLFEKFQFQHPWTSPLNEAGVNSPVRIYLCPSHPGHDRDSKPAVTHYAGSAGLGADAPTLSLSSPRAGFFGYDRVFQSAPGKSVKGQSNTLLCGETTRNNGAWAACGPSTVRGVIVEDVPLIGLERTFGGCHREGANLLMVDGHVIFFNERGNPETLARHVPLQEYVP